MLEALEPHELNAEQLGALTAAFRQVLANCRLADGRSSPVLAALPEEPGCYLWVVELHGRQFGVYVGRTNSIRRRATDYSAHFQMHSPNDFKMRLFQEALAEQLPEAALHLYYEHLPLAQCARREAELIRMFRPLINELPAPDEQTRRAVEDVYRRHYRGAFASRSLGT